MLSFDFCTLIVCGDFLLMFVGFSVNFRHYRSLCTSKFFASLVVNNTLIPYNYVCIRCA